MQQARSASAWRPLRYRARANCAHSRSRSGWRATSRRRSASTLCGGRMPARRPSGPRWRPAWPRRVERLRTPTTSTSRHRRECRHATGPGRHATCPRHRRGDLAQLLTPCLQQLEQAVHVRLDVLSEQPVSRCPAIPLIEGCDPSPSARGGLRAPTHVAAPGSSWRCSTREPLYTTCRSLPPDTS